MLSRLCSRSGLNIGLFTALLALVPPACDVHTGAPAPATNAVSHESACPGDNGGIVLSPGFCATIFADNIGHVRHMAIGPNGVLYVNTWSGRYFNNDTSPPGGFLVALRDTQGTGHADVITRFGDGVPQGSAGGSGIAFYRGAIYAEQNDKILRYALPADSIVPSGRGEVILSGLPLSGDHPMHPFIIDAEGNLFVDLGSATNACQEQNRMPLSPGPRALREPRPAAGSGAMTPTSWARNSRRPGGTPPAFATARVSASMPRGASSSRNMAAISSGRTGRSSIRPKAGRGTPRRRRSSSSNRAATMAGRNAISTAMQKKLVLAPEYGGDGEDGWPVRATHPAGRVFSRALGAERPADRTNSHFPAAYRAARLLPFTDRGTARRGRRAATTSCSSR